MTLRTSPLDAAHRALGAKMVPFGGWDMPLVVQRTAPSPSTRHAAPAVWCSTSATSAPCASEGAEVVGAAAGRPHQRPRQGRAGAGPVHPPARRGRRVGARRHHRVVARRRPGLRRHAQRLQHRAGGGRDRWRGRHRLTGDHRGAGAGGPRAPGDDRSGRGRRRTLPGRPRPSVAGADCTVAGTGYTGEDGVELAVPADAAPVGVGGAARHGARCRPASAPATRCASRRRCRSTATSSARASRRSRPASAGSSRGTRTAGSAAATRSLAERERGVARRLRGLSRRGSPPAPRRAAGADRRRGGGRRHERQLLADARARHRAGVPAAGGRGGRRGRPSTSRGEPLPARVVPTPFVAKR